MRDHQLRKMIQVDGNFSPVFYLKFWDHEKKYIDILIKFYLACLM